jgi:hypothetical protein
MSEMTNDQPVEGDELLPDTGVDTSHDHQTDDGQGSDEGEDEVEDFEFNGKTITVPKALKEELAKGLLLHKDYTQKTQDLAEQRRAHEADQESAKAENTRFQTFRTESVKLATVREQLAAFNKVDWAAAAQADAENGTQTVTLARIQMDQLKDQASQLEQSISKLDTEGRQALATRQLTAMANCETALAKEFPKWAELKPTVETFVKAHGVSEQELKATTDPRMWRMMHYAKLGYDAAQRTKTTAQVEGQQATRPAPAVAGARTMTKVDPTSRAAMSKSADDWAKQRNAELDKQRGRGRSRR